MLVDLRGIPYYVGVEIRLSEHGKPEFLLSHSALTVTYEKGSERRQFIIKNVDDEGNTDYRHCSWTPNGWKLVEMAGFQGFSEEAIAGFLLTKGHLGESAPRKIFEQGLAMKLFPHLLTFGIPIPFAVPKEMSRAFGNQVALGLRAVGIHACSTGGPAVSIFIDYSNDSWPTVAK